MDEQIRIKGRLVSKHDIELNWLKATNFVPLASEHIVYDAETPESFAAAYATLTEEQKQKLGRTEPITYARTKLGNGVDSVNDLPFQTISVSVNTPNWNASEAELGYIKNRTHYEVMSADSKIILEQDLSAAEQVDNTWIVTLQHPIVPGQAYEVQYSSTAGSETKYFTCTAFESQLSDGDGQLCLLGNGAGFGLEDMGTDVPFLLATSGGVSAYIISLEDETPNTTHIKLEGKIPIVKELPERFIQTPITMLTTAIQAQISAFSQHVDNHINSTSEHVGSSDRTNWNDAYTHAISLHAPDDARANVIEKILINDTEVTPTSNKEIKLTVDSTLSETSTNPIQTNAVYAALDAKATKVALSGHTTDKTVHITADERTKWNKAEQNVQSDWNETSTDSDAYIRNKPEVIIEGDTRLTDARTPTSHSHGELTNDGKLNTASRIVVTSTTKAVTTGTIDPATLVVNTDARLSDKRDPKDHTQPATSITEDASHRFVTNAEKSAWNSKLDSKPNGSTNLIDQNNRINTSYLPDAIVGQMKFGGIVTHLEDDAAGTVAAVEISECLQAYVMETLSGDRTYDSAKVLFWESFPAVSVVHYRADLVNGLRDDREETDVRIPEGYYFISNINSNLAIEGETEQFYKGDWLVVSNGKWETVGNTDTVRTVNGKIGDIVLTAGDVGAYNKSECDTNFNIKTSLTNGSGKNSLVFHEGQASGNYAIAGGSTDKSLLEDLAGADNVKNITPIKAKAAGMMSMSIGTNTEANSPYSAAFGFGSRSGIKGYYWNSITISGNTATLILSKTRDSLTPVTSCDWAKGDYVSIVNTRTYAMCATIVEKPTTDTTTGSIKIKVDSVVFGADAYKAGAILKSYDRGIFAVYEQSTTPTLLDKEAAVRPRWAVRNGEVEFAFGAWSHGFNNLAAAPFSTAEGQNNIVAGDFGHVEGRKNVAGTAVHAEGHSNFIIGTDSHGEGYNNTLTSTAINGHVEGSTNKVSGDTAHGEGYNNTVSGTASHGEGSTNTVASNYSHGEGYNNNLESSAIYGHVEGRNNTVSGDTAHGEGYNNTVSGVAAHGEGANNTVSGNYAHVEGNNNEVTGARAHGEGESNLVSGSYAHAEGSHNEASGKDSHAEGNYTKATKSQSHAQGYYTEATGDESFAAGNHSKATGKASYAGNYYTEAKGSYSQSSGCYTVAAGTAQTVIGKYNIEDTSSALIIGGGAAAARKNAATVDFNGNAWFANKVTFGAEKYSAWTNDFKLVGSSSMNGGEEEGFSKTWTESEDVFDLRESQLYNYVWSFGNEHSIDKKPLVKQPDGSYTLSTKSHTLVLKAGALTLTFTGNAGSSWTTLTQYKAVDPLKMQHIEGLTSTIVDLQNRITELENIISSLVTLGVVDNKGQLTVTPPAEE